MRQTTQQVKDVTDAERPLQITLSVSEADRRCGGREPLERGLIRSSKVSESPSPWLPSAKS